MDWDNSEMDWQPQTPDRFSTYPEDYIPGGWPNEPPTPTAGLFARPTPEGFFLPATKKVCRGLAIAGKYAFGATTRATATIGSGVVTTVDYTITRPTCRIVREVNLRRRGRPNTPTRRSPHRMRQSPWHRAVAAQPQSALLSNPFYLAAAELQSTVTNAPTPVKNPPSKLPKIYANVARKTTIASTRYMRSRNTSPKYTRNPATRKARTEAKRLRQPFPYLCPENVEVERTPPTNSQPINKRDLRSRQISKPLKDVKDNTSVVSSEFPESWKPARPEATRHVRKQKIRDVISQEQTSKPVMTTTSTQTDSQVKQTVEAIVKASSSKINLRSIKSTVTTPAKDSPRPVNDTATSSKEGPEPIEIPSTPKQRFSPRKYLSGSPESEISSTCNISPGFKSPEIPSAYKELYKAQVEAEKQFVEAQNAAHVKTPPRKAADVKEESESQAIQSPTPPLTPERQLKGLTVEEPTPKAVHYSEEKVTRKTRAEEKRDKFKQEAKQYQLKPLNAEWNAKVDETLRKGTDKLKPSDFARVVPSKPGSMTENWLNDEVINAYLDLIVAHGKQTDHKGQTVPSHHAFNSFFYSNLASKGPDSVKRWAKKAKIGGKDLLDTKYVFIPINSGAHWTLCVVSGEEKTITYYDSMSGKGQKQMSLVRDWVKTELGSAYNAAEWTELAAESPQQSNMDDCGVFTITTARQIMLGLGAMSYGARDVKVQRRRIVAEIVNGGLLKG